MENFYTLLASTGINAIISARASNSEVKLTKIAVGDGDIIPSQDMTALKSEKHRFNINSIIQNIDNPNYLIIEGVIPSNVGGFYVSEVAIYTDQNTLFAIGSLPKTYKPLLEEGSAKDLTIKIFLEVTNADSVNLKVDDSVVLATRKFVLSELKKYAFINGDETKKFKVATPEGDYDAVNKKYVDENAKLNINSFPKKTTPVDTDNLALQEAGGLLKKVSFENLTKLNPNDERVKTALNATGIAPIYACRAWVNFKGTGAVAIRASGNVSSITDNGVGNYKVNFTTAMLDVNYSTCLAMSSLEDATYQGNIFFRQSSVAVGSIVIFTANNGNVLADYEAVTASVFR